MAVGVSLSVKQVILSVKKFADCARDILDMRFGFHIASFNNIWSRAKFEKCEFYKHRLNGKSLNLESLGSQIIAKI